MRRLALLAALALAVALAGAASAQVPDPQDGSWRARLGRHATVHHVEGMEALADAVGDALDAQPPLPALPAGLPSGVDAFLAPDPATFDALAGGRVPEWSGGVAVPALARLVIPAWEASGLRGERARVLRHEWAHLGLHAYLEGLRIPRWFDEGYAEWSAGWDRGEAWRLRLLLATGRAPPLDSLALDWPRDAASAGAAYLLAATAVEYLVSESGEEGLARFLERWRATGDFDAAIAGTYGTTPGQLEEHWRAWVRGRYGWVTVLSQSLVLWMGLVVLLAAMLVVRHRRDRERMARLRASEAPERPAYWTEDEDEGEGTRGSSEASSS